MDEIIAVIATAQRADGYLATQTIVKGWKPLQQIIHHELYVMGHLITAACVHYKVTGKGHFLHVARKTADYLYNTFISRDPSLAHFCFNPSQIMALAELYRITGERRYLEIAVVFIEMRGSMPAVHDDAYLIELGHGDSMTGGTDLTQDRVPLKEETSVVGHTVLATYLYCGAADVYIENGDAELLEALQRLWRHMTETKLYVTGGAAAIHNGLSIRDGKYYDIFWEGVGDDYELPNSTAYNETCAQIGNMMWNYRMLQISGDARHAEIMENTLYNGIISGIALVGNSWFYTNPLRWYGSSHRLLFSDSSERFQPGYDHVCCPSNLLRTIAGLHHLMYGISEEGIWVHMYGGSTFDGKLQDGSRLRMSQQTNYPWEGHVRFTIEESPGSSLSVKLRIPEWAIGAKLSVNGTPIEAAQKPNTYAVIERIWQQGDVIELELPMDVKKIVGHPKIETTRNQVTLKRGPIVYCLESVDLPDDVSVSEVYIPRKAEFDVKHEADFLRGITVLEGYASIVREGDWSHTMYKELSNQEPEQLKIRMIPYFAWNNRGIQEMSVWLPLI
jgi:DUF1680 family protein